MIQQVQDVSILGLEGELGSRESESLCDRIASLARCEWNKIVLDLSQVEHIHYTLVPRLVSMAKGLNATDGGVKLANPNPETKAILRFILGQDEERSGLETYDSVAEAVLSFHKEEPPFGSYH